jgi:hypothetical protein
MFLVRRYLSLARILGLRMGYNGRNDKIRDNVTRMQWRARSASRRLCDRAPLQRETFSQRLFLVLAEDFRRAHIKAPLACDRLRQLRDGGRFGFARESHVILTLRSVLRFAMCSALAAMAMVDHGLLLCRDTIPTAFMSHTPWLSPINSFWRPQCRNATFRLTASTR